MKPGLLDHEHLATLTDLQREREEADYAAAGSGDAAGYDAARARVDRALAALRKALEERGITSG